MISTILTAKKNSMLFLECSTETHFRLLTAINEELRPTMVVTLFSRFFRLGALTSAVGRLSHRVTHCTSRKALMHETSAAFWWSCSAWGQCLWSRRAKDVGLSKIRSVCNWAVFTRLKMGHRRGGCDGESSNCVGKLTGTAGLYEGKNVAIVYFRQGIIRVINLIVPDKQSHGNRERDQIMSPEQPCLLSRRYQHCATLLLLHPHIAYWHAEAYAFPEGRRGFAKSSRGSHKRSTQTDAWCRALKGFHFSCQTGRARHRQVRQSRCTLWRTWWLQGPPLRCKALRDHGAACGERCYR